MSEIKLTRAELILGPSRCWNLQRSCHLKINLRLGAGLDLSTNHNLTQPPSTSIPTGYGRDANKVLADFNTESDTARG